VARGGSGACGRGGRAPRTRGALGNRPCPLRGAAFNGWTRRAKGGETCLDQRVCSRPRSEVRSQGRRSRRGGTPEGVAVCLYFPAIRETSRGRYQGAPFGVPPPSLPMRARSTEIPTHADRFAGSDDARPEGRRDVMQTHAQLSSPGLTGRPSAPRLLGSSTDASGILGPRVRGDDEWSLRRRSGAPHSGRRLWVPAFAGTTAGRGIDERGLSRQLLLSDRHRARSLTRK
jgi:hypothetical protein